MASGRLHSIATLNAATAFVVAAATGGAPIGCAAGAFAGLLLTPDLDVDEGNISDHFVRGVHWSLEFFWDLLWLPYRKLIGHRSFFSHFPVVGTLVRLAYVLWPFCALFSWLPPLSVVVGLIAVDTIHFVMDWKVFSALWR